MQVNAIGPVVDVEVTGDGAGVTSQAGTRLLGEIANHLGVTRGLSQTLASTTSRSSAHDRGRMLTQLAMMIAAGGRAVSDLATLRDRPELFGPVASDATAWRACHQLDDERLAGLVEVRQRACRRLLAGRDEQLVLDVDATLLNLHCEGKQGAAATFKGTYGFAPMACFIEPVGLAAGMLRPGNATANHGGDQLAVIDEAIGSLPAVWRAGHRPGDEARRVKRRLKVRADTAGGTKKVLVGLAARNLVFSVGMRTSDDAVAAIKDIPESAWQPAVEANGSVRDGAQVAEWSDLVPAWAPHGTRAIVRRERPHPGASLRLWDYNGWRHQVTLTNDTDDDITALERFHRAHAQVENRIKQLKDTGLSRLPFSNYDANRLWFELVLLAALLLAGLRHLVADDPQLAVAEPRRLRYTLLNVAAKLTRHARRTYLKLDRAWPWTGQLIAAHRRLPRLATVNA